MRFPIAFRRWIPQVSSIDTSFDYPFDRTAWFNVCRTYHGTAVAEAVGSRRAGTAAEATHLQPDLPGHWQSG